MNVTMLLADFYELFPQGIEHLSLSTEHLLAGLVILAPFVVGFLSNVARMVVIWFRNMTKPTNVKTLHTLVMSPPPSPPPSPSPCHHAPTPPPFRNIFEGVVAKSPSDEQLDRILSFELPNGKILTICHGNICDFYSQRGMIVNSANEHCIEGRGVDQAISEIGGEEFEVARGSMPADIDGIKCPTGQVKVLGPRIYGALQVEWVAMAVPPDYNLVSTTDAAFNVQTLDNKLRQVHMRACIAAHERKLSQIAFPLMSCGAFLGDQQMKRILEISLKTILYWTKMEEAKDSPLTDIVFVAYSWKETKKLVSVAKLVCSKCVQSSVTP